MTYRVARMTCSNCNEEQRVRIAVEGDAVTYPSCVNCGLVAWTDEPPKVKLPPPSAPESEAPDVFATLTEWSEFMGEFQARQTEWLRQQFAAWQEQRREHQLHESHGVEASIAAMFREVWEIMESGK